ncbi:MAG: hypothetical protein WCJ93_11295 [Methanomicrobiales archaeon]
MKIAVIILFIIIGVLVSGCMSTSPPAAPSVAPQDRLSGGTSNASIPNLTGRWTGLTTGHVQGSGFFSHHNGTYIITEQQGYAFAGHKEYIKPDGNTYYENFSGAISPNGELIMADSDRGYSTGWLTGPDSMNLLYGEDGPTARAFIQIFTRQK